MYNSELYWDQCKFNYLWQRVWILKISDYPSVKMKIQGFFIQKKQEKD